MTTTQGDSTMIKVIDDEELQGWDAIEYKESHPEALLCKFADPVEGALVDLSVDEARAIADKAHPLFIYIEDEYEEYYETY